MRTHTRKPRAFRPMTDALEDRNAASSLGLIAELAAVLALPNIGAVSDLERPVRRSRRGLEFESVTPASISLPPAPSGPPIGVARSTRGTAVAPPNPVRTRVPTIRPLASSLEDLTDPAPAPTITLSSTPRPLQSASGGASPRSASASPQAVPGAIRPMTLSAPPPTGSDERGTASTASDLDLATGSGFATSSSTDTSDTSFENESGTVPTAFDLDLGTGSGFATSSSTDTSDTSLENQPLYAWDDYAIGAFGTPFDPGTLEIHVLDNDWDPDSDPITVIDHTDPSHGTVTVDGNGTFTYKTNEVQDPASFTPFMGTDEFTYTISDGHGHQSLAMVRIEVTKVKVDLALRQSDRFTPAPENGAYQAAVDFSGTDRLGPLLGQGHPGVIRDTIDWYVCQIEVVGTVQPAEAVNLEFSWESTVQYREWIITSDGTKWTVTKSSESSKFPTPQPDGPWEEHYDATPDPQTRKIFMTDTSGSVLGGPGGQGADVKYVRSERNFVFRVNVSDGGTKKAGELKEYQTIITKRVANTGTVANDWQGSRNDYTEGSTDVMIDAAEVRAMVGGNLPIEIDDNSNRANEE